MTTLDLTPLYRSSVGFDRFGSLLDAAFQAEKSTAGYPPYNIEVVEDDNYAITLAVAGFKQDELDVVVEHGVLTVKGQKANNDSNKSYLHQGIATRSFERKFTLADHVKVIDADLSDGLLTVNVVREVPEALKPRSIAINGGVLEHKQKDAA